MLLLQSGDDTSHSSGAARAGKGSQSSATGRDFVSPINWRNVIMTPSRNSRFFNLAPMKSSNRRVSSGIAPEANRAAI